MHFFEGIGNQRYSKRFLKRNKSEIEAFWNLLTNDWRNRLFILYCRQMENPIAIFYPTRMTPTSEAGDHVTAHLQFLASLKYW